MKRLALILVTVLAGCWLNAATAAQTVDNMTLNGMSTYSELLEPYYIGALYLEAPSNDPAVILDSQARRRLELRVTAQDYSPRRFSVQWTQALLINTPQETLNNLDDAFVQWLNIAQHGLTRGDQVVVDGYPDGHSEVRVDGVEIFRVRQPGFLNMLLGAWIGKRPPSSDFKNDMLNMTYDAKVVAEYDSLGPTKQRVASVKGWSSKAGEIESEPKASHVAKNEHEPSHEKAARHDAEKPRLPPAQTVAAVAAAAAEAPKPSAPATAEHKSASGHEAHAAAGKPTAAKPQGKSKSATAVAAATKGSASGKSKAASDKPMQVAMVSKHEAVKQPEHDDAYRAQQALLLKLYKSAIIKRTLKKVRYPRRAIDRNQQGEVDVAITVARNGEVQGISLSSKTRFHLLNDAAQKAIADTGRYPVVPAALEGDTVTVTIPVKFRLQ